MKRLSFLLFLVCLLKLSIASTTNELDSLYQVVNKQGGKEKLGTLVYIGYKCSGKEQMNAITNLKLEAESQSNTLFLAWAYQQTASYFAVEFQQYDSTMYYSKKGIEELEKLDLSEVRTEGDEESYNQLLLKLNSYIVTLYTFEGKYYLAINHIQQLLEKNKQENNTAIESDIYLMIGRTLTLMDQPKEGLEYLKKGLSLNNSKNTLKFVEPLQDSFAKLKQYDDILTLNDSIENLITQEDYLFSYDKYFLIVLYYTSAYALIQKEDLTKARIYIDKLAEEAKETGHRTSLYAIEYEYYYKKKEYNKALENINLCIASDVNSSVINSISYKELKSRSLRALGRGNDAYDYLNEVLEARDSLNIQRITSQMQEFETIYRTDKLKDELALSHQKLKIFRLHVAGFITITFLMLVLIIIITRGNRRLRKKNVELYKKHQEIDKVNLEMENLKITQLVSENNSNSDLVLKLDNYMKESEAFLNSDITRDSLALELGTNRQYLIDAIREYKEQTFNEYIYSWRLKHTYNLIILNKNIPITEIFLKSGFASRRVFNREFKKEFGMTPSELRTAAEENQD